MAWVRIRSRRSFAFWGPLAGALLLALLFGLCAQLWATDHIRHLRSLAESEPQAAAVVAGHTIRGFGWLVGGFSLVSAALLARYFQLGLRQGRLPPHGWWSLGAHRAATGTTAQRLGQWGLWLAAILALVGVATALLVDHLLDSLLAARLAA